MQIMTSWNPNARKTLPFHHAEPWIKKNGEENFDVPMGCKRSELISKWRHENKNMLANIGNSGKRNNDSMD